MLFSTLFPDKIITANIENEEGIRGFIDQLIVFAEASDDKGNDLNRHRFILELVFETFHSIKSVKLLESFYQRIKPIIEDLVGSIPNDVYIIPGEEYLWDFYIRIRQSEDLEDYFILRQNRNIETVKRVNIIKCLEGRIKSGEKIAIVGAEKWGQTAFGQLFANRTFVLEDWFDENPSQYGYPVRGISEASKDSVDAYLVTYQETERIQKALKQLKNLGIDDKRIIILNDALNDNIGD